MLRFFGIDTSDAGIDESLIASAQEECRTPHGFSSQPRRINSLLAGFLGVGPGCLARVEIGITQSINGRFEVEHALPYRGP